MALVIRILLMVTFSVRVRRAEPEWEKKKPFRRGGRARAFGACLARTDARQPFRPDLQRSGRRIRVVNASTRVVMASTFDPSWSSTMAIRRQDTPRV